MSPTRVRVRVAQFPGDKPVVTELFGAYAAALPISLDFQDFGCELVGLPGRYGVEERGVLLLACVEGEGDEGGEKQVVGCVALRMFGEGEGVKTCELKRLFLKEEARGKGVARLLMDEVLRRARELGYSEMLLDTLGSMTAAQALYRNYGFEEIPSYYQSVEGAVFYRLVL